MANTGSIFHKCLGLFVAVVLIGGMASTAYAETIQVVIQDTTHDIEYTGTNAEITRVDVDLDFTSIIFTLSVAEQGSISITLPRDTLDSQDGDADEEFIIIVDGSEPAFTERITETNRILNIELPAGAGELEIIGTVFNKGIANQQEATNEPEPAEVQEPAETTEPAPAEPAPPEPEPAIPAPPEPAIPAPPPPEPPLTDVVCTTDYTPVCGADGKTYSNSCNLGAAGIELNHDGECRTSAAPSDIKCGQGTVIRDGLCVPACGQGLALEDGVCVISSDTPTKRVQAGFKVELAYGVIAGFAVAFVVIIVLGIMAKANKSK